MTRPSELRRGGRAVVYGVVTGDLVNDGGDIEVYGNIAGTIHEHAGRSCVHPSRRDWTEK